MQIIHKITDFLFTIFPELSKGDEQLIIDTLAQYYSYGPFKPKVTIDGEFVIIDVDTSTIVSQDVDYRKAIELCEKRNFKLAKPILEKLIQGNPTISEYHRVLGQILSEEGNQEDAIDCLIDALKWDPKNGFALIMMGNIYTRYKDDIDTAIKYYNEALNQNPNDHIAITNLGTNLIQLGKWEDGLRYLEQAFKINQKYPNTCFGLGLANEKLGRTLIAFEWAIEAAKNCGIHDQELLNQSIKLAFSTAEIITKGNTGKEIFNQYKSYLEIKTDKSVKVEVDDSIPTAAKMEYAENYNREYHLIKHKSNYLAVEHLMMHELVHLDFSFQAQTQELNKVYVSTIEKEKLFISDYGKTIHKLKKDGYSDSSISNFMKGLYVGINRQIFNTPIDLFIEDFLYKNYPELRPFQFISLYALIMESKDAVTDKKAISLPPK